MSLFHFSVPQLKKMLGNLDNWLTKGGEHAQKKSFDPNVLAQARLAPDQFPLLRQVMSACDTAKFAAARVTGKTAPTHPDTEQTIDELKARIRSVVAYLDTFSEKDFEGAETRVVPLPFLPGKGCTGQDYLSEWSLPNFYFHVTTAYAILRHNGVELGKVDYIGGMNLRDV